MSTKLRSCPLVCCVLPLLAACAGGSGDSGTKGGPGDSGAGGGGSEGCGASASLRFLGADGSIVDLGTEASAGADGAPATLVLDDDGTLEVCGGTWWVNLVVGAADLTVRGDSSASPAVLDGGGAGPIIDLTRQGASLVVEDVALTGGLACYGSAIRAADFATECDREAGPLGASITVRRAHLHGNAFDVGGGAIGTAGSIVVIEDSLVADNEGHAVFAVTTDVRCSAAAGLDAGLRDNTKSGVWSSAPGETQGFAVTSAGCDFGGNGQEDVRLGEDTYFDGYGEDAVFTCDARTLSCDPTP